MVYMSGFKSENRWHRKVLKVLEYNVQEIEAGRLKEFPPKLAEEVKKILDGELPVNADGEVAPKDERVWNRLAAIWCDVIGVKLPRQGMPRYVKERQLNDGQ